MDSSESTAFGGRHLRQDQVLSKHFRGKGKEWGSVADREQPLRLLDLPVDLLQAIISQVTHTNDLCSLALTHSALHALVIPHIYSRFDIVWPDNNQDLPNRTGVDALTYGLNTLVMAQDVFGETSTRPFSYHPAQKCAHCGKLNQCSHNSQARRPRKTRRGNHFAQYTRKFSLGNGPAEWVQDYAITKESGKMLGTLIALAVGRMRNLEEFTFDMPTGVLRDVWIALASLADREDGGECRLDKVWVRWHDNSDQAPLGSATLQAATPTLLHNNHGTGTQSMHDHPPLFHIPAYPRVEFPTFSILPPLKSLTVLDIDELPYAEEMSVLIETSAQKLRELRIGVAQHAQFDPWIRPAEDRTYVPSVVGTSTDQISRAGGILGILILRLGLGPLDSSPDHSCEFDGTSDVEHAAVKLETSNDEKAATSSPNATDLGHIQSLIADADTEDDQQEADVRSGVEQVTAKLANQSLEEAGGDRHGDSLDQRRASDPFTEPAKKSRSSRKLKLEVLELERVPLSLPVLLSTIDWSRLATLTLLGCRNHEQLWKALRKRFAPPSHSRTSSLSLKPPTNSPSAFNTPVTTPQLPRSAYPLAIRHLHTDTVSHSLLTFLYTTLAPDTLVTLFLQATPSYKSPIPITHIYKLAIRRHRSSLRKLLIDSSFRPIDPDNPSDTTHLPWLYPRELLAAITSPKMQLRELSLSLARRDWHFFLQRLPQAKTLRSLHIARIAEAPSAARRVIGHRSVPVTAVDPRETALQILDIVALRPELELCYLGVAGKCFEVLEYDTSLSRKGKAHHASDSFAPDTFNSDDQGDLGHDDDDDDGGGGGGAGGAGGAGDSDDDGHHGGAHAHAHHLAAPQSAQVEDAGDSDIELGSVAGTSTASSDDEHRSQGGGARARRRPKSFKLREILFYDDKIAVFKARHGRL